MGVKYEVVGSMIYEPRTGPLSSLKIFCFAENVKTADREG
jgi:hypothetical protein